MKTFDGYNAHSPTLQPSQLHGTCMGPEFAKWKTAWIDRTAPICSGDLVRLHITYAAGITTRIIKQLECTRDGRWWGACHDGVFEIGTLIQPTEIEKVVALSMDGDEPRPEVEKKAPPEEVAYFAELAADAVDEWERLGKPVGIPFPGLQYVNAYSPQYRALT